MPCCYGSRNSSSKSDKTKKKIPSSLNLPIEAHWHQPERENKKKVSLSRMSFKTIQESLTEIIRSSTFKGIFQSIHDPKEEQTVELIRKELIDDGKLPEKFDDYHTLLRFLRMRAFNVPKAKEMFLTMIKWREDFGVDSLVKEFEFEEIERVKKCYPHGYHGVDRYGRPVYIERLGLVDLNSLLKETSINRYIKYHVSEQEKTLNLRYPACSLATKKHIASTTMILDVKGVGLNNFSKPARELFVEIQKIDSNYYPETLNKLYIINAGSGFKALWRVLKAFLEARTLSKIQVLGTNYHTYLFEAIDPTNIPEFLGGKCNCSTTGDCLTRDKGPWTNPQIDNLLEEVFTKGEKFNEEINETGESSEQKTANNDNDSSISFKRLELEDWLEDTNKILNKLVEKQRELGSHIEQLKKLASEEFLKEKI